MKEKYMKRIVLMGLVCVVTLMSCAVGAQQINIVQTNLNNITIVNTNPVPVVVAHFAPTNQINVQIIMPSTNPAPKQMVEILNGDIDPALGPLLFQDVTGNMSFKLEPFGTNAFTTLKYRNLTGAQMSWPANIWWMNGSSPPTNQFRGWVYFEETKGEIWASP